MFETIAPQPLDAIMELMQRFGADPRPGKVDLVIGVYKDAEGRVPIMRAVRKAEARRIETEETKTYQGMAGDPELCAMIPRFVFGADFPPLAEGRVGAVQTIGGSGALRVGADLLAMVAPEATVWLSTPTWPNHEPLTRAAGLKVDRYPYFRPGDRGLDFDGMMGHLAAQAKPGDVLLLHACCHNPTGVDLAPEHWAAVTDFVLERGLMPFVDCAYQGLGRGLEADAAGLRHMAARVPEMLVANSFSKNFGIYRERCGGLSILARSAGECGKTLGAAKAAIRANYSMPPAHGARIVANVLGDPALTAEWQAELDEMRARIAAMRAALRAALEARQVGIDLGFLTEQTGMFSYTGFTPDMVARLREERGIYMVEDGRINVAGLSPANLEAVADAFASVLRTG